ncbi:electron transfer flavoprotein [Adlercreutzia sp. R7]|uniref:Electron transfer flavoprotein small subunit n=1 Tax=Adlercreutzia wanghongyangiae TaxID=3111451 RepID=A0ABU6IEH2_9ACTN|nr:electron transfer flavoprotein [Adlercreutzia sp. R7]
MPNVVACYKWVMDEADVKIASDLSVDTSRAKMKISDYDRNAIQAGVEAAAALGGSLIGLSYGDDRVGKSVKDALSRGLDELVWVNDSDAGTADSARSAAVLAAAVGEMSDVALVICADGSSDQFSRQTAPRMGALMGWPVVTAVSGVSFEDGKLVAERQADAGIEVVEVALPAVIAVLPEAAEAPIPGLRQIMQASKKPSREISAAELAGAQAPLASVVEERGYAMDRKNVQWDAADEGWLDNLTEALRKEGVL